MTRSAVAVSAKTPATDMNCRADLMVIPMGKQNPSTCDATVECEKIFAKHGLKTNVHAMATNVEGDLGEVFESVRDIFQSSIS